MKLPLIAQVLTAQRHFVVTHTNFQKCMEAVMEDEAYFQTVSYTKPLVIDRKTIERFKKSGHEVLSLDKDGKGFRLMSGKNKDYVIPGNLLVVEYA